MANESHQAARLLRAIRRCARLWASRETLHDYGNMSSATLMFALGKMLKGPRIGQGIALAFGPGLAAEGFGFRSAA